MSTNPLHLIKHLSFPFFCALATLMHTRVVVTWVSSLHFPLSATHSSRGCRRVAGPEQNLGSYPRLLHPMMSMGVMSIMPAEDLTPRNCSATYCLNQNSSMLCHGFRSFTDTRSDSASFLTRSPSHGRHYYPDVIHHLHSAVPRSSAATCALFSATSRVHVVNCTTSPRPVISRSSPRAVFKNSSSFGLLAEDHSTCSMLMSFRVYGSHFDCLSHAVVWLHLQRSWLILTIETRTGTPGHVDLVRAWSTRSKLNSEPTASTPSRGGGPTLIPSPCRVASWSLWGCWGWVGTWSQFWVMWSLQHLLTN